MYQKSITSIHGKELDRWHVSLREALTRRSQALSPCCRATLHLLRDHISVDAKERQPWKCGSECKHVHASRIKDLFGLMQRQKRELDMLAFK